MAKRKRKSKTDLVPVGLPAGAKLTLPADQLPTLIAEASAAARFAYEEFIFGTISNENTRIAYTRAINQFLAWCHDHRLPLQQVAPKDVGQYLQQHQGSIATKKQHLAAIRHLFDKLVTRHAVILNPAASVRGERYQVVEGKTPEITIDQARHLLGSIDTAGVVGLRDRAAIATMIYTAARVGAIAKLKRSSFRDNGNHHTLRFLEKGGKSREIPVRHDLQEYLTEYLEAAELQNAPKSSPLFRTAIRRQKQLTKTAMTAHNMCRMFKRRLTQAGLPDHLSPHGLRATAATDLLEQGVPLEDVQYLLGHADPRTTRLYDRRRRKVTRNIVERISV